MEGARAAQYDTISDSSGLGGIRTGGGVRGAATVLDACYSTPAGDPSTLQDSKQVSTKEMSLDGSSGVPRADRSEVLPSGCPTRAPSRRA